HHRDRPVHGEHGRDRDLDVVARNRARSAPGSDRPQAGAHLLHVDARRVHPRVRLGRRPLRRAHGLLQRDRHFTVGSILCGASTSLGTLIAARVFQGLGGAMMVPVGRLVLLRSVPKSALVNALAYLTVPALIGPVAGPPLGGFITTYFHWRWIFWINVPIGVLGVLLSLKFIQNLREQDVPRFDFKGFVLSGVGLLSLISGLSMIGRGIAPLWEVAAMVA